MKNPINNIGVKRSEGRRLMSIQKCITHACAGCHYVCVRVCIVCVGAAHMLGSVIRH